MTSNTEYRSAIAARDINALRQVVVTQRNLNKALERSSDYRRTPLHMCVWEDWLEGARLLLNAGADVNAVDALKDSPFLLAASEGRLGILRSIMSNAAAVKQYGSANSLRAKLSVPDYSSVNRFGNTALMSACQNGYVDVVRVLLANGMDVNFVSEAQRTALLSVVERGGDDREHVQIVAQLIAAGAAVDARNADGRTPLSLAKEQKLKRITAALEAAGAHE